jgi:hypothetical protein
MKHTFQLTDFPDSSFVIETCIWNGGTKLFMNNAPVIRSGETGRPFLVPATNGNYIKVFTRQSFRGLFVPALEINGKQNHVVEKLNWLHYTLGSFPILLLFVGGVIGGAMGGMGMVATFSIFIQQGSIVSKYIKVTAAIMGIFIVYFLFTVYVWKTIN